MPLRLCIRTGSLLVCSGDVQSTAMAGHICACPKFASAEIDSSATRKVKSEVHVHVHVTCYMYMYMYMYMYVYMCVYAYIYIYTCKY